MLLGVDKRLEDAHLMLLVQGERALSAQSLREPEQLAHRLAMRRSEAQLILQHGALERRKRETLLDEDQVGRAPVDEIAAPAVANADIGRDQNPLAVPGVEVTANLLEEAHRLIGVEHPPGKQVIGRFIRGRERHLAPELLAGVLLEARVTLGAVAIIVHAVVKEDGVNLAPGLRQEAIHALLHVIQPDRAAVAPSVALGVVVEQDARAVRLEDGAPLQLGGFGELVAPPDRLAADVGLAPHPSALAHAPGFLIQIGDRLHQVAPAVADQVDVGQIDTVAVLGPVNPAVDVGAMAPLAVAAPGPLRELLVIQPMRPAKRGGEQQAGER